MYPSLFEINGVQIRTQSFILLLACVTGVVLFRYLIKRRTLIDPHVAIDLTFWIILGLMVGARSLYVILNWSEFQNDPIHMFYIWEGGTIYYGGFILASLLGSVYMWVKKVSVLPLLDAVAPPIALVEAMGRLGCFVNGCCFGKPTNILGITFPEDSFASAVYGSNHTIWPTQLFQVVGGLVLFTILMFFPGKCLRKGQLIGIFLAGTGALRFTVNFLRYYPHTRTLWTNQIIALVLVIIGIVLFIYSGITQKETPSRMRITSERTRSTVS